MGEKGGREDFPRRRHRRDRDRQGDHGGRGRRRGYAGTNPGAGRHRGRRGQYPDRHDPVGRRGCRRAQGRRSGGAAAEGTRQGATPRPGGEGRRVSAGGRTPTRAARLGVSRAAEAADAAGARRAGRHRDGHDDGARGPARRHGGRDAARRHRFRDGRGGRRVSGRLQGDAGAAAGVRRASAWSTPRSPSTASPGLGSVPRWRA